MYALTGGQDALINAYLVSISGNGHVKVSSSPRFTLVGHADNVSTIGVYGSEYIVSGSWDATVKVWKHWECVETYTKHELAVWSVLPIDANRFVSASADKGVYLWAIEKPRELLAAYTGATQPVRGLAQLSSSALAACGNDAQIRVYPLDAQGDVPPQASMGGHTSFVYALAALGQDTLVSSGEDHTLRVWQRGALAQVITLPAISVWCVCALPNGDVACGTSDGQVRIFTPDAAQTSAERIAAFEASVAAQVLAAAEIDADVPSGERTLLDQPGTHEGATCVVHDGSRREVYRYSTHAQAWKRIGQITEAAGASQKKMHNGQAYDYVFDVDVEDGAPPLKLPYNANENPYEAAQRFLSTYELPATYLDQVVQFLEKNTQAVGLADAPRVPEDVVHLLERQLARVGEAEDAQHRAERTQPRVEAKRARRRDGVAERQVGRVDHQIAPPVGRRRDARRDRARLDREQLALLPRHVAEAQRIEEHVEDERHDQQVGPHVVDRHVGRDLGRRAGHHVVEADAH